ncbi:MAG: sulfatase family protein [Luteolibacter sp.]
MSCRLLRSALITLLAMMPLLAAEKPNFVVILADDLGYADLGCYGAKDIKTPHLDALAKDGTRFTDFYVPAGQCTPTRAAFLTGSYPQRVHSHQLFNGDHLGLNPDEVTIAELLRDRGYRTGCIGKWHLGNKPPFHPNSHGFDEFYGFLSPSYDDKAKRLIHRNRKLVTTGPESSIITDDLTEEALKFIRKNKEQPFFLYLAHDMPHVPLELPAKRRGVSKGGIYGDVIEHLDASIGRVIDELQRQGLEKNTVVIFTSDNGPALHWSVETGSALPLRGSKHTTCEGGFRVPGIAWGPGIIPAGKECSELLTIMDLLPTFVQKAGGKVPNDRVIDGKDVWPLLTGEKGAKSPHEAFFYYKRHTAGKVREGRIEGVRVGKWKLRVPLTHWHDQAKQRKGDFKLAQLKMEADGELPPWSKRKKSAIANLKLIQQRAAVEKIGLYDLSKDIGESNNLAGKHPEKVKELHALMKTFDKSLRANSRPCGNINNPQPKPQAKTKTKTERTANFIVILTDDLGYGDLGCYGAKKIKTREIDRMAAEGMKFTDFYATAPICTPTRASLMTGCYPSRVGPGSPLHTPDKTGLHADEITIAEMLKTKGYATAYIGKWHLGHQPEFYPTRHGFDFFYGTPLGHCFDTEGMRKKGKHCDLFLRNEKPIPFPPHETLTEVLTEESIKWIHSKKDQPFFLFLSHPMPHGPVACTEKFRGKSKGGPYGDAVEAIDWSTGRILDTIRELKLDQDTFVVFTSDNGACTNNWGVDVDWLGTNAPFRGKKQQGWEGGLRVPFVVWGPGRIHPGSSISEVASIMDLLPTFAVLSYAKLPQDRIIDGKDISPLFCMEPDARSPHEAFIYHARGGERCGIRMGKWKLLVDTDTATWKHKGTALYDLSTDPGEKTNLAAKHPDKVKALKAKLAAFNQHLSKTTRPVGLAK